MIAYRLLPLVAFAALLASCGTPRVTVEEDDEAAADSVDVSDMDVSELDVQIARLTRDIDAAAGEARAQNVAQCRYVGVGAKACGGPDTFKVYSEGDGDPARLRLLAESHVRISQERNDRLGLASDCAVTPEPELAIVGGRCVAVIR